MLTVLQFQPATMGACTEEGQRAEIQAVGPPQGYAALQPCPLASSGDGKHSGVNLKSPSAIYVLKQMHNH